MLRFARRKRGFLRTFYDYFIAPICSAFIGAIVLIVIIGIPIGLMGYICHVMDTYGIIYGWYFVPYFMLLGAGAKYLGES